MRNLDLTDTIAAIATPVGESGIGIVRLSGKDALSITDKIFLSKDNQKPSSFKTYTMHYGWIVDHRVSSVMWHVSNENNAGHKTQDTGHRIIDEVVLTIMRSPRSFTKEDVVEINCHGGIVAMRAILDLVLANGARLANPGEFTKRAFLNGRIDLAQAEAVLDIIRAKTDSALCMGMQQLKGGLSNRINAVAKALLDVLALMESNIDFPDEEIGQADLKKIRQILGGLDNQLKDILDNARQGRVLREGISVVICGKPNVGKSSLLNALLKQERSIVTPVAGTTRDTIEEIIDIKGIPIKIVDTAGILEPRDLVERKAVLRSKKYIHAADLVIVLFDGSKALSKEDELLIRKLKNKTAIAVINKIDLVQKLKREKILGKFQHLVELSAKKAKNIDRLEDVIVDLVYKGRVRSPDSFLISNLRHIEAVRKIEKLIAEAMNSMDNKLSLEFIAQDMKDALSCIDELLGKKFSEGLLDKIFSEFCIGK